MIHDSPVKFAPISFSTNSWNSSHSDFVARPFNFAGIELRLLSNGRIPNNAIKVVKRGIDSRAALRIKPIMNMIASGNL